jgi:AcrR family transcriptional regulator
MRALAKELHVPTMTIYNYVPNREALARLVVNHILSEIRVPPSDAGPWEERLRIILRDARRVFADHPGVSTQFGDGETVEGTRLAEGVLKILRDAMADAIVSRAPTTTLEGVTNSASFSRDELFDFGFDAIITGLKAKLLSES